MSSTGPIAPTSQGKASLPTVNPVPVGNFKIDPVVAQVSPELYAAGARTSLTRSDVNLIENWANLKNTHQKLMAMNNVKAQESFDTLDPQTQQYLKEYYQIDYANKPTSNMIIEDPAKRKLLGLENGVNPSDLVRSPMRLLMALGSTYSKYMNAPYGALQQKLINGESLSKKGNWSDAFDGKYMYDQDAANALISKYGGAKSFAAMHILAGKTPAEIIDAWGPNDGSILQVINDMYNKQDEFSAMLDEFGYAQLSPGRDIARWLNKKLNIEDSAKKKVIAGMSWSDIGSGAIDFAFQIFADPLTYLTGGTSLITKAGRAEKLASALLKSNDVKGYLAIPEIAKYFTGYTEHIAEYSKAVNSGDYEKASEIKNTIRKNFSEHGTDEEINLWHELRIKDLDTFGEAIGGEKAQAFTTIIRGRTVNGLYAREGAAFSRSSRTLTLGVKQKTKELFTGKDDFASIDKKDFKTLVNDIVDGGLNESNMHEYTAVDDVLKRNVRTGIKKQVERLTSLHPGSKAVYLTNDKVFSSLEVFRKQAYIALNDKRLADMLTEYFAYSTEATRFAIKKGVDEVTLRRMGLHGMGQEGKDMIDLVIGKSYSAGGSMGVSEKLTRPASIPGNINDVDNAARITGSLYAWQFKDGISSLPWNELSQFVAKQNLKIKKGDNILSTIPKLIGGVYDSTATKIMSDVWSLFVLAPMLGIRTVMDEGFMFALYAKTGMLKEFPTAKRFGRVMTAYSGDKALTGPYKDAVNSLSTRLFRRPVGVRNSISDSVREDIQEKHLNLIGKKDGHKSFHEADTAARDEVMDLAISKYGRKIKPEHQQWLKEAASLNPNILADTSSQNLIEALIGKQGIFNTDSRILSESQLDLALKGHGKETQSVFESHNVKNMSNVDLQLAMFRNFVMRFSGRGFKIDGKHLRDADPAYLFLTHGGLKDARMTDVATNKFMKAIGFENSSGAWKASNSKAHARAQEIINSSRQFSNYDGLTDGEKMVHFLHDSFTDLYHTFHGNSEQFNDKLLRKFSAVAKGFVHDHHSVMQKLDFEDYKELTKNHLATDRIFSDIDFKYGDDLLSWVKRYGIGKSFELMSRQTDGILRQPILHMHYLAYRTQYLKKEQDIVRQILNNPETKDSVSAVKDMVSRQMSEIAMNDAAHHVLKYTDNPEIRTVFSFNMKTVGRFYRAVEDFHRRMYRLTRDNGLGSIYRLRLMSQGMAGVGAMHTDVNGDQYVVMPFDDIIYSAVDTTMRALTGNDAFVHQPLFNDITLKLTAGNPSFQTDAGLPYLSGPAGALSVLAVKNLLGKFDATAQYGEDVDNLFLGSLGGNTNLRSAVTPKLVNNIWKMLSPDERSVEEVSAFTQSISYNQANGLGINPEDYVVVNKDGTQTIDVEKFNNAKTEYLNNVRIGAHNIIVLRSLLGMILPMAAQSKDTKDLPEYLKFGETTSMRKSFYDLYDQIKLKYPDAQDPYELTMATWIGKNPGKTAYLVSTNSNDVKPVMQYSNQMQDWALRNRNDVARYGTAALIFAPKIGDFSPGVWQWANATGINQKVGANQTVGQYIDNYFNDVILKQHVNAYYDLNNKQDAELAATPFNLVEERRAIVSAYEQKRKGMKLAVPGLSDYISKGIDNTIATQFVDDVYTYATNPGSEIKPKVKTKILEAYDLYKNFVMFAQYIDSLQSSNGVELKRQEKDKVIAQIKEIIATDETKAVDQYFNFGLLKLMTKISRDASSSINRNVAQ